MNRCSFNRVRFALLYIITNVVRVDYILYRVTCLRLVCKTYPWSDASTIRQKLQSFFFYKLKHTNSFGPEGPSSGINIKVKIRVKVKVKVTVKVNFTLEQTTRAL
jgi:hypothetical protein